MLNKLNSLALLRGMIYEEPLISLVNVASDIDEELPLENILESYGAFCAILYELRSDADFSEAIWDALVDNMNPYLKSVIEGAESFPLRNTLEKELDVLTQIGSVDSKELSASINYDGYIPEFTSSKVDFKSRYLEMISNISTTGYGVYARNNIFKIVEGKLEPVKHPDPIRAGDLFCYEMQREKVVNNTRNFVEGRSFADVLLYGDAGTGKSSTVKAASRMFFDKGVRLVELPKSEINNLADVIEYISNIPLKFIIFIDDISFDADDDRIGSLKSVIEGAASGGRKNVVIYATSNRRHMIKETFSARENEIHSSDTIAEQMSLSERFGLRVLFDKPNKITFLEIVKNLMKLRGIEMPEDEMAVQAERFATRSGGRSARVARQFVDSL
ncbi:MAG: ATP-binding protein [Saccharofermentans sp.]|nr:ATP-binding protein [Saccharofermentans sp.]